MTVRDRRALLLGTTTVLAAMLVLRVCPWVARRAIAAERTLAAREELLARTRAELAGEPALADSVGRVTRAVTALAPRILSGQSAAEAGADLAARLNLEASRHHARLLRSDPLGDSLGVGRLGRVAVRATIETDIRGLADVLRAVADDPAVLTPEDLHVNAGDPAAPDNRPEVLQVEMTVTGWFLRAAGAVTREAKP